MQRDLHAHAVAVGFHVDGFVMQHLLAAIEMLHKLSDATGVFEFCMLGFPGFAIRSAFICKRDG